ncbi:EH signature domain-containing protein [Paraburkholderia hospita]|uniref:EH signature domain-containing protein n=1 Tax=Paraburkholderia hospita TaxID=169430 RepID=UPI0009A606C0|nr:EH signature domain-containing protein [Paraburkholderia hospita]SKC69622.1 EH_Signature domain-containing protein [Paraburkholderia hospita]
MEPRDRLRTVSPREPGFLDRLKAALPSGRGPVFSQESLTEINDQIVKLTNQLMGRTPSAPEDAILEAVQRFAQEPRFKDSRDALLVSLGCDRSVGTARYRLIEDVSRFPAVLAGVDRFRKHVFVFKDCYKGLLDTYLVYHPEARGCSPKARPNWESLRTWLDRGVTDIREPGELEEEWVIELAAHPELFSESPVQSFGRELLEGDEGAFLKFQKALGISEASWLLEQLVLAQIRAAGESRSGVAAHLSKLLHLLEALGRRNPPIFNSGLAELLTYYHAQSASTPSLELRDFLLDAWGAPDERAQGWMLVSEGPLEMARSWFNLHVMQQFFNVLAKEGKLEKRENRVKRERRLNFWEKYADVVSEVRFALGPHARTSTDERMVDVLRLMSGLTLELQGGGKRENNAFIMKFGEWVVVEFGVEGNACFIYRSSDVPFERGDTCVSAQAIRNHIDTASGYSSRGPVRRIHASSGGREWEEIFKDELEKRGIFQQRPSTPRSSAQRWVPRSQSTTATQVETKVNRPAMEDSRRPVSSSATQSTASSGGEGSWRRPIDGFTSLQAKSAEATDISQSEPLVRLPFGKDQERQLFAQCRRMGIEVKDMRDRQGNLWIVLDKPEDSRLTPLLKSYGFKYRPGRGWWH